MKSLILAKKIIIANKRQKINDLVSLLDSGKIKNTPELSFVISSGAQNFYDTFHKPYNKFNNDDIAFVIDLATSLADEHYNKFNAKEKKLWKSIVEYWKYK